MSKLFDRASSTDEVANLFYDHAKTRLEADFEWIWSLSTDESKKVQMEYALSRLSSIAYNTMRSIYDGKVDLTKVHILDLVAQHLINSGDLKVEKKRRQS